MELLRQKNVRLIAVNENVDSFREDDDFTPFRNIMNEWYARDTSKKIKSTFKAKGKSGKHVASTTPYGYLKDPENPDHWIVDEEAAKIVQRIFHMTMDGRGPYQIARILKEEKVEIPAVHMAKKDAGLWKSRLSEAQKRVQDLEKLLCRIYEDNILGKLPDERYAVLDGQYSKEQKELSAEIAEMEAELSGYEEGRRSAEKFIAMVDKYQNFEELTTYMLNEFVEKIVVHERDRKGSVETTQE